MKWLQYNSLWSWRPIFPPCDCKFRQHADTHTEDCKIVMHSIGLNTQYYVLPVLKLLTTISCFLPAGKFWERGLFLHSSPKTRPTHKTTWCLLLPGLQNLSGDPRDMLTGPLAYGLASDAWTFPTLTCFTHTLRDYLPAPIPHTGPTTMYIQAYLSLSP